MSNIFIITAVQLKNVSMYLLNPERPIISATQVRLMLVDFILLIIGWN
jgi:hypothetical protein